MRKFRKCVTDRHFCCIPVKVKYEIFLLLSTETNFIQVFIWKFRLVALNEAEHKTDRENALDDSIEMG